MLAKIKIILGNRAINYTDELLQLMIDMAQAEVLDYTKRDAIDNTLESIIIQIVIARINKMGAEGIASQSYSGVSESYLTDIPAEILRLLNSKRRIRVVY